MIFRRSETTSSAFSGMMNSIWEKLYYAYSQNNIQHILTCKSIMNPKCYITSYDVTHLRQIFYNTHVHVACMVHPLSCVIDPVALVIQLEEGNRQFKSIDLSTRRVSGTIEMPS